MGPMEAAELGSRPRHHTVHACRCLRVASMALCAPPRSVIYHLHRYFSHDHLLSDKAKCGCRVFAGLSRSASIGSIGLRRSHCTVALSGVTSLLRRYTLVFTPGAWLCATAAVRSSLSQAKGLPSMARFTVLASTAEKSWR